MTSLRRPGYPDFRDRHRHPSIAHLLKPARFHVLEPAFDRHALKALLPADRPVALPAEAAHVAAARPDLPMTAAVNALQRILFDE